MRVMRIERGALQRRRSSGRSRCWRWCWSLARCGRLPARGTPAPPAPPAHASGRTSGTAPRCARWRSSRRRAALCRAAFPGRIGALRPPATQRAGAARRARADAHAASGRRLLSRPRLSHRDRAARTRRRCSACGAASSPSATVERVRVCERIVDAQGQASPTPRPGSGPRARAIERPWRALTTWRHCERPLRSENMRCGAAAAGMPGVLGASVRWSCLARGSVAPRCTVALLRSLRGAPGEWCAAPLAPRATSGATLRSDRGNASVGVSAAARRDAPAGGDADRRPRAASRERPLAAARARRRRRSTRAARPAAARCARSDRRRSRCARAQLQLRARRRRSLRRHAAPRRRGAAGRARRGARASRSPRHDLKLRADLRATPLADACAACFGADLPEWRTRAGRRHAGVHGTRAAGRRRVAHRAAARGLRGRGPRHRALADVQRRRAPAAAPTSPASARRLAAARGDRRRRPALLTSTPATTSARCSPRGRRNQRERRARPRGASTLTQQLAKLLYRRRRAQRRAQAARAALRGGDGAHARQGAHPAAVPRARALGRRRVRRRGARAPLPRQARVDRLDAGRGGVAREPAAQPGREWQRALARGEIDRERVERIVAGMRPMSAERRAQALESLGEWKPPLLHEQTRGAAAPQVDCTRGGLPLETNLFVGAVAKRFAVRPAAPTEEGRVQLARSAVDIANR